MSGVILKRIGLCSHEPKKLHRINDRPFGLRSDGNQASGDRVGAKGLWAAVVGSLATMPSTVVETSYDAFNSWDERRTEFSVRNVHIRLS
jgi:hypothetical protein